jgi:hypothetical protein
MVEITLPAGTIVKIKGIPVELVTDTTAKTAEGNARIISSECPDCMLFSVDRTSVIEFDKAFSLFHNNFLELCARKSGCRG